MKATQPAVNVVQATDDPGDEQRADEEPAAVGPGDRRRPARPRRAWAGRSAAWPPWPAWRRPWPGAAAALAAAVSFAFLAPVWRSASARSFGSVIFSSGGSVAGRRPWRRRGRRRAWRRPAWRPAAAAAGRAAAAGGGQLLLERQRAGRVGAGDGGTAGGLRLGGRRPRRRGSAGGGRRCRGGLGGGRDGRAPGTCGGQLLLQASAAGRAAQASGRPPRGPRRRRDGLGDRFRRDRLGRGLLGRRRGAASAGLAGPPFRAISRISFTLGRFAIGLSQPLGKPRPGSGTQRWSVREGILVQVLTQSQCHAPGPTCTHQKPIDLGTFGKSRPQPRSTCLPTPEKPPERGSRFWEWRAGCFHHR